MRLGETTHETREALWIDEQVLLQRQRRYIVVSATEMSLTEEQDHVPSSISEDDPGQESPEHRKILCMS